METIQHGIVPLVALAFVLGLKHGMDADHLATIDGLTRFNAAAGRRKLARWCGFLFSLGHGVVVCTVAVAASLLLQQAAIPEWMDEVGLWVSVFFLVSLGVLNLHAVFTTPADEVVQMVGLKGRWLGRFRHASHPVPIALVGGLFALSFDTLSQATLFSAAATQYGGILPALLLALCFMAGMMVTDAANGLWISHLLQRADATARTASRLMGVTVALLSLLVAALALSRRFLPEASSWQQGQELLIGGSLVVAVSVAFLFANHSQRRASALP